MYFLPEPDDVYKVVGGNLTSYILKPTNPNATLKKRSGMKQRAEPASLSKRLEQSIS